MDYITIPEIARKLGIKVAKAHYIVKKLDIDPVGRAGAVRLYDPEVVGKVRAGLYIIRGYVRR